MCDHTLSRGRKNFWSYCLQAFSTEKISKYHVKNCYKAICKQKMKMPKKSEYVKFEYLKR